MTGFDVDQDGLASWAVELVGSRPFTAWDLIVAGGQGDWADRRSRWQVAGFLVYLLDISDRAWRRPPGFFAKGLLADAVSGPAGEGLRVVVQHRVVGPVLTLEEQPVLDDRPTGDHATSVTML